MISKWCFAFVFFRLWHQLTLKLQELVNYPSLRSGDHLIQLYNNFLTVFENKLVYFASHCYRFILPKELFIYSFYNKISI